MWDDEAASDDFEWFGVEAVASGGNGSSWAGLPALGENRRENSNVLEAVHFHYSSDVSS